MILEMFMASDGLKHEENKYESTYSSVYNCKI